MGHNNDDWYIDSGVTAHMTPQRNLLKNSKTPANCEVIVADNSRLKVDCAGDINLQLAKGSDCANVTVNDVLCIPDLCTNLLSVSQMIKRGKSVVFNRDGCTIYNAENDVVATASMVDNMFKLDRDVQYGLSACDN